MIRLSDPYMKGEVVVQIQNALKYKGYNVGNIDGIYGPNT